MSAQGSRRLIWANGEDDFCIAKVGSILALEEKCGAGIGAILKRIEDGGYYLNDVRETIRLGLIGAGMGDDKAMRVVKLHVDGQPLAHSVLVAYQVLLAALVGIPDDPVGKTKAAGAETQAEVDRVYSTTTAASAAPPSSASGPDSDGNPETPTMPPSGSLPPSSTATTEPTPPASPSPIP